MPGFKKRLYLDYASSTPLCHTAAQAMRRAGELIGNPGASHAEGVAARASLQASREGIAAALGCKSREIIFTSGLTESNNLAILGAAEALQRAGTDLSATHWIVSSIEHPSVLECFAQIEYLGGKVTHIEPESGGVIAAEKVERALRTQTVFVSIGWGNNEIGTLQPLSHIARIIRAHEKTHGSRVMFHCDAGQAPLYLALQVHSLGLDLFSLGSGKLYGPRGIGALYVGARAQLAPLIIGGGQERGLRAGTEEVALAAGFAEAMSVAAAMRAEESERLADLRNTLAHALVDHIPGLLINGDLKHALPHMLNISIPNINAEYLALSLDRAGIALSTKSACSEGNEGRSHVVAALGGPDWRARNTLRFSLGRDTSASDIKRAGKLIPEICAKVRSMA